MLIDLEKLRELWAETPYGYYLNAVDDLLEALTGTTSAQEELAYIAECQEESCLPSECAASLILDAWNTAKVSSTKSFTGANGNHRECVKSTKRFPLLGK